MSEGQRRRPSRMSQNQHWSRSPCAKRGARILSFLVVRARQSQRYTTKSRSCQVHVHVLSVIRDIYPLFVPRDFQNSRSQVTTFQFFTTKSDQYIRVGVHSYRSSYQLMPPKNQGVRTSRKGNQSHLENMLHLTIPRSRSKMKSALNKHKKSYSFLASIPSYQYFSRSPRNVQHTSLRAKASTTSLQMELNISVF